MGLALLALGVGIFFAKPYIFPEKRACIFAEENTDFKVLILPFKPYGCNAKDDIGAEIQRQLKALNDLEKLEITSHFAATLYITENFNQDSAHLLKERYCADMVIHGNYRKDECTSQTAQDVCFSWYMDSTQKDTERHDQLAIHELRDGKMQGTVRSIIFWTAAKKSFNRKNYAQALRHFLYLQDTLKVEIAEFKLAIGYCYEQQKQFENAKKYYLQSIELDSNISETYNNLGYILDHHFKDYANARKNYEKAIELNPNQADAYNNLGYLLANDYFKKYEEARKNFEKAIESNPKYATAYYNLGVLLANDHFKDYKESRKNFEKAIEVNPKSANAYNGLGALLANDHFKDYENARKNYEKAIDLNPKYATAYNNLGSLLLNDHFKDYENAEKNYKKALAIEANDAVINFNYAFFLFTCKPILIYSKEILFHYRKAIKIDPNARNLDFEKDFEQKTGQKL